MAKRWHVRQHAGGSGLEETPFAIPGPGASDIAESTLLLASFQPKDILIGAHKLVATLHLLDPLNNLGDVERLSSAAEYVMYHLNLRRTFSCSSGFRRPGAQTLDGLE